MNFQKLYEKLERIVEIEKNYKNRKLSDINKENDIEDFNMTREHSGLVNQFPEVISVNELISYHQFLSEKIIDQKREVEEYKNKFKLEVLEKLRDRCSHEAYPIIESVIESLKI